MNKIILNNDEIENKTLDETIDCELSENSAFGVNVLKISIKNDTDIELSYNFNDETKIETQIYVGKNINVNIFEKLNGIKSKIRTKYYLEENGCATISKINDMDSINEYVIINLQGQNSKIKYNLKTIAKNTENYDILTYHNEKNTVSDIITNGVNIRDGKIKFNVSSFIPNGVKNCDASQNNKIINLTDNECIIKPNLYIDEFDVTANHAAWIGNFNEQELFYLMSRGINKEDATKLLINGFLISNMDITDVQRQEIIDKINKYWR